MYSPVPVPKQVCAIYAGANGLLDAVPVSKIKRWESDFHTVLDDEKTILEAIEKEKAISPETEEKLKKEIQNVVELHKE